MVSSGLTERGQAKDGVHVSWSGGKPKGGAKRHEKNRREWGLSDPETPCKSRYVPEQIVSSQIKGHHGF